MRHYERCRHCTRLIEVEPTASTCSAFLCGDCWSTWWRDVRERSKRAEREWDAALDALGGEK